MGPEFGTQTFVGRGGDSDDTMKHRCPLIEDERFPGSVADRASAFFDEQDSGREIPFVLRLDGEGSLDTTGCDQGQCIGDGVHRAAPSGFGERRPSADPKFPRIDHDDWIEVMRKRVGHGCAVQKQSAAAHGREKFID